MRTCCHCGAPSYSSDYCDPCDTDSCLMADANGDTYCGRAWEYDGETDEYTYVGFKVEWMEKR